MSSFRRRLVAIAVSTALAAGAALVAVTSPATAAGESSTAAQDQVLRNAGLLGPGETWACLGDGTAGVTTCLARFGYSLGSDVTWGGGTFAPYTGNCTHYAAWRAKNSGAASFFDRKGTGSDTDEVWSYHAKFWDEAARNGPRRATVDRIPRAGDIAQWDGIGYSNHVAYVEYVAHNPDGSVAWIATSEAKHHKGRGGARRAIYVPGTSAYNGAEFIHIGGTPPSATPALGEGSIARTPDGKIWVIAGGAKYHLSGTEWAQLGYPAYVSVPTTALDAFGSMPGTTILRNSSTGVIYQIIGGFKQPLHDAEYAAIGRPAAVSVPAGFIARADRTAPIGVHVLRAPDTQKIFQVIGGIRYWLNGTEYAQLGSPAWTAAPSRVIGSIPTSGTPEGAWFLRDPDTTRIYQVIGGVKFWLNGTEYAQLGNPDWVGAPAGFINRIPDAGIPQGTWYLRDPESEAIYQVTGGTKRWLNGTEYAKLGSPAWIGAPTRLLNLIPNRT